MLEVVRTTTLSQPLLQLRAWTAHIWHSLSTERLDLETSKLNSIPDPYLLAANLSTSGDHVPSARDDIQQFSGAFAREFSSHATTCPTFEPRNHQNSCAVDCYPTVIGAINHQNFNEYQGGGARPERISLK